MFKLALVALLTTSSVFATSPCWNLTMDLPGMIDNGTVLWARGTPSASNPKCFEVVQKAFDTWRSIPNTSLKFECLGDSPDYPNEVGNIVTWSHDGTFFGDHCAYVSSSNGYRIITFNDNCDWSDNDFLLSVALHEIGHFIGFVHSPNRESLMYPIVWATKTITQEEVSLAQLMYPQDGVSILGYTSPDPNIIPYVSSVVSYRVTAHPKGKHPYTGFTLTTDQINSTSGPLTFYVDNKQYVIRELRTHKNVMMFRIYDKDLSMRTGSVDVFVGYKIGYTTGLIRLP